MGFVVFSLQMLLKIFLVKMDDRMRDFCMKIHDLNMWPVYYRGSNQQLVLFQFSQNHKFVDYCFLPVGFSLK